MAYPDVIALLNAYLEPYLLAQIPPAVPVVTRVPTARPARFVQIRRVGGAEVQHVRESVRVDAYAWAATDPEAMALAMVVRQGIHRLANTTRLGGVMCYRVEEFLGPRQADDPLTGSPRAWATYALLLRVNDAVPVRP